MTQYHHRLPEKAVHDERTSATVMSELADLNLRFFQHQANNAKAFYEDFTETLFSTRILKPEDIGEYWQDAAQRCVLFWDAMRQRGNNFIEHQAVGNPPVLTFPYEVVVDGMDMERPVNYQLVRILPSKGIVTDPKKRPFVIFDPRAGHGAGIAGFKPESQVGIALQSGHPVYFIIFRMHPVAGQTLRDVARTERRFLEWVVKHHPNSDKPCVLGNCQGGWSVMGVAAAHPELTGPLVLSGAPLSYWAGATGKNPMRYLGGLIGGGWLVSLLSDIGAGEFDGANLVANFEMLDPGNTFWSKYYNLYTHIDTERQRFLDFERWWGGYMFLTSDEMRGIVGNLFIGNKLSLGMITISKDMTLDLRRIQQPIIIFCSVGDNITPPQQALYWIADLYDDERAIKAAGQVIVYMIHETTGHLGIFVSSAIVGREHQQIAATLEQIESLPPGLYEMKIIDKDGSGKPDVRLEERTLEHVMRQSGITQHQDDAEFELVKVISEFNIQAYEMFASGYVRAASSHWLANLMSALHPMRVQHWAMSDLNPLMAYVLPVLARQVEAHRRPVAQDNPMLVLEKAKSKAIEYGWNLYRDFRDDGFETLFYGIYGNFAASGFASRLIEHAGRDSELERTRDEALKHNLAEMAGQGDFTDAVMRILLLITHARGHLTRSEINQLQERLAEHKELAPVDRDERRSRLRRQTIMVAYQPEMALATLPELLSKPGERKKAIQLLNEIDGIEATNDKARRMWQQIQSVLEAKSNVETVKAKPAAQRRRAS